MKEEIETKHFEYTLQSPCLKPVEVGAFHYNFSRVFLRTKVHCSREGFVFQVNFFFFV